MKVTWEGRTRQEGCPEGREEVTGKRFSELGVVRSNYNTRKVPGELQGWFEV